MALALLYLVLALVAFVAATVVATLVMGKVQARRGGPKRSSADAATVSMLHRRRQRLDRRLGIDPDADSSVDVSRADQDAEDAGAGGDAGAVNVEATEKGDGKDPGEEAVANGEATPRERADGGAGP